MCGAGNSCRAVATEADIDRGCIVIKLSSNKIVDEIYTIINGENNVPLIKR